MSVFFVSDTHFGHKNVIQYSHRPFADVDEMDATMASNWNAVVQPGDDVYHLGDFALCNNKRIPDYVAPLNGRIHLILGNHDKGIREDKKIQALFASVRDYHILKVPDVDAPGGKQRIVLSHYSFRVWDQSHRGAWQLYGHSHGTLANPFNLLSMDVGVDATRLYAPVSYDWIKQRMAQKRWEPCDHHEARNEEGEV